MDDGIGTWITVSPMMPVARTLGKQRDFEKAFSIAFKFSLC